MRNNEFKFIAKVYVDSLEGWQECKIVHMYSDRAVVITKNGTQLNRILKTTDNAVADGCVYWKKEKEDDIEYEKTFYCKGSGERHYDISSEYYINTFEDEEYIDICYCENPEIEGVTIDRKDILKIAEIIKQENKESYIEEKFNVY